jgi:hypothetical protein
MLEAETPDTSAVTKKFEKWIGGGNAGICTPIFRKKSKLIKRKYIIN